MKVALCSTFVPFILGGARNIVEWLKLKLEEQGHHVEIIYLPQVDVPDLLFNQMMAYRWVNLDSADRIICFRPQSHLIPHPQKIVWFIHHIRVFYDLWSSSYRGFPDDSKHQAIRSALHQADRTALKEAKRIFTNSRVISERLKSFNNLESEVLYPPLYQAEKFICDTYNNEIVYICRLEHHKRQHLLIEAMQYTKTNVCLRLCGKGSSDDYSKLLTKRIMHLGLQNKVILENRWITEEEKIKYLSKCLAAAYLPLDEDSYGYPTIEASHAEKAILTTLDSGGVLEFVKDGINGHVVDSSPIALAEAMDKLYCDKLKTIEMGKNARARVKELNISWDHVLEKLLG